MEVHLILTKLTQLCISLNLTWIVTTASFRPRQQQQAQTLSLIFSTQPSPLLLSVSTIPAWKYQLSAGLFQPFFQLSAGIVGIVGPLFSPPPSQQRSDAASARFFLPQHYNKISPPFLEGLSKRCGQVGTSGGATGARFGPASMYDLLARYTLARYIATKMYFDYTSFSQKVQCHLDILKIK